jgi:aminoglycoside phosphotransferase family enzyme/predicted kinase
MVRTDISATGNVQTEALAGAPRSPDELSHLVERLCRAEAFPHPVEEFRRIETHISIILLTGDHVYKFKKPVDLGFLDFTDPARRHFYCEEELRLNRRLAPELYEGVVAITGSLDQPHIGDQGPSLEYAVQMRQFATSDELDRLAARGELKTWHIDQLCRDLARFHGSVPVADEQRPFGEPEEVRKPALENFAQILPHVSDTDSRRILDELRRWTEQQVLAHNSDFRSRKAEGWIRECHGDLHLGNITLWQDKVRVFDCIEFSEALRWIDTMSDLAFLLMDLDHRGLPRLGVRLLNQYLEYTGDYLGLSVLRFYLVYRAMVRAKVAVLQMAQTGQSPMPNEHWHEFQAYLNLARLYTQPPQSAPLIVMHGLSGSGKSWVSQRLLEHMAALRVRSDVERKRLFGLAPQSPAPSGIGEGLYTDDVTKEVYRRLYATAYMIIDAGFPAILDATFLSKQQRDYIRRTAATCGVPFVILDVQAPEDRMRERIAQRMHENADASDASFEVLEHQLATQEPLTDDEWPYVVAVDNNGQVDFEAVAQEIRRVASTQKRTGSERKPCY